MGTPPEQQMSREKLDEYMASAGLQPARMHDFLPEQYFVEYVVRQPEKASLSGAAAK